MTTFSPNCQTVNHWAEIHCVLNQCLRSPGGRERPSRYALPWFPLSLTSPLSLLFCISTIISPRPHPCWPLFFLPEHCIAVPVCSQARIIVTRQKMNLIYKASSLFSSCICGVWVNSPHGYCWPLEVIVYGQWVRSDILKLTMTNIFVQSSHKLFLFVMHMQARASVKKFRKVTLTVSPKGIIISDTETNDLVEDVSIYRYKTAPKQTKITLFYHNLKITVWQMASSKIPSSKKFIYVIKIHYKS